VAYCADDVSTESGSDRVIVLAISIIAIGFYPVATALGTDSMMSAGFLPQIRPLPEVGGDDPRFKCRALLTQKVGPQKAFRSD